MNQKAEIAEWILSSARTKGMNQSRVAEVIGVSKATLSRWCNAEDSTMPAWQNISALSSLFGTAPPGWAVPAPFSHGFSEHGVEALNIEQPLETWNGNVATWVVRDNTMQTKGYLTGDEVKTDARIQPRNGDVVVAILSYTSSPKRTALRLFREPCYLVSATADTNNLEIHEVGKTAEICGVVFESVRRRSVN